MKAIPQQVSESTKRRNPRLYGETLIDAYGIAFEKANAPAKRLRQNPKPLLNKLEDEFYHRLSDSLRGTGSIVRPQAKRYRLANGVTYCPDFTAIVNGRETAWEVKGKHAWDDAMVKIKVAATSFPEIKWILCWKDDGEWKEQDVLP